MKIQIYRTVKERVDQNPPIEKYAVPRYRLSLVKEAELDWPTKKIQSAQDVFTLSKVIFEGVDRESVYVFLLDQKHTLLGINMVSMGTLTESLVHPRELFKAIVLANAAAFVMVHNHPSGDPTPSRADRQLTDRIKNISTLTGVRLLDSIVASDTQYYSFAESGALAGMGQGVIRLGEQGEMQWGLESGSNPPLPDLDESFIYISALSHLGGLHPEAHALEGFGFPKDPEFEPFEQVDNQFAGIIEDISNRDGIPFDEVRDVYDKKYGKEIGQLIQTLPEKFKKKIKEARRWMAWKDKVRGNPQEDSVKSKAKGAPVDKKTKAALTQVANYLYKLQEDITHDDGSGSLADDDDLDSLIDWELEHGREGSHPVRDKLGKQILRGMTDWRDYYPEDDDPRINEVIVERLMPQLMTEQKDARYEGDDYSLHGLLDSIVQKAQVRGAPEAGMTKEDVNMEEWAYIMWLEFERLWRMYAPGGEKPGRRRKIHKS